MKIERISAIGVTLLVGDFGTLRITDAELRDIASGALNRQASAAMLREETELTRRTAPKGKLP